MQDTGGSKARLGEPAGGSAAAGKVGIDSVICEECGETNKAGTEFCMFCGAFLGWQEQENPPGTNDVTQTLPAVSAAESVAPATSGPAVTKAAPPQPAPAPPAPVVAPNSRPRHQPTPVDVAARSAPTVPPLAAAPPTPPGCPTCGRPVETGRRFCGHCGVQLIYPGANAPVTRPTKKRDTWWSRLWDSKDRTARRAYRRSLPPLYRWRRVIIVLLALGLIGGGLTVIGRSPKSFVLARYHDVRNTIVNVPGVMASIIPPEASAAETTPDALVDGTAKPWLMNWTDSTEGSPCGVTPTTAVVQLSFASTRIREIDMRAGMLKKYGRTSQYRPKTIWVAYADECHEQALEDLERQNISLDTKVPVTSLRIGVITAFPPDQPKDAQQVLGFTEITLEARPPVR